MKDLENLYRKRKELIEQGHDPIFSEDVNAVEDEIAKIDPELNMGLDEVIESISAGQMRSIFDPV